MTLTTLLNKRALTRALAERTGLTPAQASDVIDAALETWIGGLRSGARVSLPGVGTFRLRPTAPRITFVPGTREAVRLPARQHLSFKAAPSLDRALG